MQDRKMPKMAQNGPLQEGPKGPPEIWGPQKSPAF